MILIWRKSLEELMHWLISRRRKTRFFMAKIAFLFVALNLAFYWLALLTTYPHLLATRKADEYILMGFPVSFLGAMFDLFSLFVTFFIIQKALSSKTDFRFVAYLSVDLMIAVLASFWVLFSFVASGFLVSFILERPETFIFRSTLYEGRVRSALLDPLYPDNVRNIYFGILMGVSALMPTLGHLGLVVVSCVRSIVRCFAAENLDAGMMSEIKKGGVSRLTKRI
jgi:hypothetical protein